MTMKKRLRFIFGLRTTMTNALTYTWLMSLRLTALLIHVLS